MFSFLPLLMLSLIAWGGDLKADARRFLDLCRESKFDEARADFGPRMAQALSREKLEEVWKGLNQQLGPIESMKEAREDRVGPSRRVKILCSFKATALDALISFDADGKIEGFFLTPPETKTVAPKSNDPPYSDPSRFVEEDVTVGAKGWPLPGTLTRPKDVETAPLVVLVHGSGPHDRDETIGPNAPFRDLAHGLASLGVAVLRYEKRTHAHKSRYPDQAVASAVAVQDETIDDALAALASARGWKGIDPTRIFVMGHSLGGSAAPKIAEQDGRLAGVILMAALARPAAEIIRDQVDYIRKLDADAGKILSATDADLDGVLDRMKTGKAGDEEKALGASVRYWKSMDALQPVQTLAALKIPALILQGGRDYQVTEADLDLFRKGLADRSDVRVNFYPDLNHAFVTGEGKAVPAEYARQGFVDARVVADVGNWILNVPAR